MASPASLAVQSPECNSQDRLGTNVLQPVRGEDAAELLSDRLSSLGRREPSYDGLALGFRLALDRVAPAIARVMRAFLDRKAWFQFGFACLDDYAREKLGRSGR